MKSSGPDRWQPYRPPRLEDGVEPCAGGAAGLESPCDEAEAWRRWRDAGDGAAHQVLVERYADFARRQAARLYRRRVRDGIEFDEYEQFAVVGLLEAIERYIPDGRAKFTTFASPRICGAILNGLEHLSEQRERAAAFRQHGSERLTSLMPRDLTMRPEALLEELGAIAVGLAFGFILDAAGEHVGLQGALTTDAYAELEMRQLKRQVSMLVERLPDRERTIIHQHYRLGRAFEEIAGELKLTKGRISQIHKQAVQRLRDWVSKADGCDIAY